MLQAESASLESPGTWVLALWKRVPCPTSVKSGATRSNWDGQAETRGYVNQDSFLLGIGRDGRGPFRRIPRNHDHGTPWRNEVC